MSSKLLWKGDNIQLWPTLEKVQMTFRPLRLDPKRPHGWKLIIIVFPEEQGNIYARGLGGTPGES